MVVIPTHDLIVLPGVTFYFQKEYFQEIVRKEAVVGEEAIFLMLKEDRARSDMKEEDFYYIGASGVIDNIDKDGNVGIKAVSRVMVDMLDVTPEEILVTATDRPDIEDMDADEQKKHYDAVKSAVLQFVQGFQWGIVARNYINQWKTMAEMVCTMSYHLSISTEEKYAIMEADKISVRTALMEKALYEFIEVTKVSNEVQKEQAETHEQLYREEAIRKQIEILQRQLDEMHPENVSDLRKFQQKIQESSMNDTARAEAEKILNRMKQEGENGHEG